MFPSHLPLEQQLNPLFWEYYLRNLSLEEMKKILLISVRSVISDNLPETKLKLQNLECYIDSLSREQAKNIICQAIYSSELVTYNLEFL